MLEIPRTIKEKVASPCADIDGFIRLIKGEAKPNKMRFAELFADQEVMEWVTENIFESQWVPASEDIETQKKHLLCEIEYWWRMGYDYIRVSGGCELHSLGSMLEAGDTAEDMAKDARSWANMTSGIIKTDEDFEKIQWRQPRDEDLWMYEFVAENLPDGMGIMACPESGFLEIPMEYLLGYENMAMLSFDNPALVKRVFDKVSETINGVYEKVVDIDKVVGFFQGDDMGYKTATMMSPDFLKQYSLPGHKRAAEIAHNRGKVYILHSCGDLSEITDYLIDEVKIDAKQSFEDIITPVEEFYERYGERIGVLGGVDVDIVAAATVGNTRQRTRQILEKCFSKGRFAIGSGNTITNYCKIENVLAMFDEALKFEKRYL